MPNKSFCAVSIKLFLILSKLLVKIQPANILWLGNFNPGFAKLNNIWLDFLSTHLNDQPLSMVEFNTSFSQCALSCLERGTE